MNNVIKTALHKLIRKFKSQTYLVIVTKAVTDMTH